MTGPDQVRAELRGIWQLDDAEYAAILRSDGALALAFVIHGDLDALFQDFAVEWRWIRESKSWLDGRTPVQAMADGDAKMVRQELEWISGRL